MVCQILKALVRRAPYRACLAVKPSSGISGPLTVGSVLRGTILNYVIFTGHYLGQPIQQPIQMM